MNTAPKTSSRTIIGMLHLSAMPGTPFNKQDLEKTLDTAVRGAVALAEGGASGCLVQTVDRVYSTQNESDPARIVGVAHITRAIRQAVPPDFKIGVMIMRNAVNASLAVAKFSGGSFVRVGAFMGATMTPDGLVSGDPHAYQHYRTKIGASDVQLVAEIDSVHFKWFGEQKSVGELALLAQYVGADAVSLGHPVPETMIRMIEEVRNRVPAMPVWLSSNSTHENARELLRNAHGAFVGTSLEKGGWGGEIDSERVRRYMDIVNSLPPLD